MIIGLKTPIFGFLFEWPLKTCCTVFELQTDQRDFASLKEIDTNSLPKELQLLYKVSKVDIKIGRIFRTLSELRILNLTFFSEILFSESQPQNPEFGRF